MKEVIALLHENRHSIVESAVETFLTSSISYHFEIKISLLKKIFKGIFLNLEKDLGKKSPEKLGESISKFYLDIINQSSFLRKNFHVQLTIIGIARVVVNNFLNTLLATNKNNYQYVISLVQKHFDFALVAISHWWKQLYEELHERDQSLIKELKIVKNGLQRHLDIIYQMIRESPVGVIGCDSKLIVHHWNPMAIRLTGYQPSDILRNSVLKLFTAKSKDQFLKKLYPERRRINNLRLSISKKDNSSFPSLISISKIKNNSLGNIEYIINFQDISDHSRFKSHVQKLDQLTAISQLSSSIMHDIRNPLNSIGLNIDVLEQVIEQEYMLIPDTIKNLINTIQGEIQRLTINLNQYLAYNKLTELHIEPINLNILINELIEDFKLESVPSKIDIKFDIPKRNFWIMGDILQLKRVFSNIIQNSIEAIQSNGTIEINVTKRKNRAIVSLQDDGSGITTEDKNHIFQPFHSTKKTGIGLGLFIVKEIVLAHKGRISYQSQPGKGTNFHLSFALNEELRSDHCIT